MAIPSVGWCLDAHFHATKRGRVIQTVRERYLRDDIPCCIPSCIACSSIDASNRRLSLSSHPRQNEHLMPSTRVILSQIDLIEHSTKKNLGFECFKDLIILESVWQGVKKTDIGLWHRLRALTTNQDRQFVYFANEYHHECFIPTSDKPIRDTKEVEINRQNKAIVKACQWYNQHLETPERKQGQPKIVVMVQDAHEKQLMEALGAPYVTTIEAVISSVKDSCPELLDLISNEVVPLNQLGSEPKPSKTLYPQHVNMSGMLAGIKNRRYFQGILRLQDNQMEGNVIITLPSKLKEENGKATRIPVIINGKKNMNRALDGDTVAIELLPRKEWTNASDGFVPEEKSAEPKSSEHDALDDDRDEEGSEAAVEEPTLPMKQADVVELSQKLDLSSVMPCGRVIGIVKRKSRNFCGFLEPNQSTTRSALFLFIPMDRKIPKIRIKTCQAETLMDQRLLVAIDSWPVDSKYPLGHYVKTLGKINDKETETKVLLLTHDIASDQFSEEVMRCLPPENWKITPENSKGRRDFRHLPIVSIDPPNCKDIDDALHACRLPNGNYQVGVHIADVTHFIPSGNALDNEAVSRGTSTYLVDRRLDMFPSLLTTKLCSLTSTEDHFAFSVLWELRLTEFDVEIVDVDFCKSIIRSCASLSYQEAQIFLDDPSIDDLSKTEPLDPQRNQREGGNFPTCLIGSGIKTLHVIAKRLKTKRMEAGALTLASPEVRFVLDTETQNPLDVQMYALRDTNALVEEFMLLANITVAKKIVRHFPSFSLLRRHPAPSSRQFDVLCSQAKSIGIELHVNSSKQLQESLDMSAKHSISMKKKKTHLDKLLRIMCTRCMMPARYFSSGEMTPAEFHHYGLAAPIYTHFTSPIRRYADVVVHRLLAAAIGIAPVPADLEDKAKLQELAEHLNRKHHAAQMAGRASVTLHTILYFAQNPTITGGVITRVKNNGIGVLLPQFGIEGTILFKDDPVFEADASIAQSIARFDADRHTLWINETQESSDQSIERSLQVFDTIDIQVFVSIFNTRQKLKMSVLPTSTSDQKSKAKRRSLSVNDEEQRPMQRQKIDARQL
uniref:Ribosomal RNA-processing protein 44 n=1 Tax=Albugo laibachii Nc14 TaxID=890382 RepID=F0WEQ8_9STRA|nr:hypothetical protein SORBIDRAFT_01g048480 [Albugo laibachii Nc14]|eukprot:CCA19690.1 hypothetical protein SORBIDRAFT_01g048480 [Albugo laibachii Nc14]